MWGGLEASPVFEGNVRTFFAPSSKQEAVMYSQQYEPVC